MLIAAQHALANHIDTVSMQADGTMTWNLLPLKNDAELVQKLKRARKENAEIRITASPTARYDDVARLMATIQRAGGAKIGIVNTSR
jgi:biopolymer transport protein ExbD